jgi:hypothetical protein
MARKGSASRGEKRTQAPLPSPGGRWQRAVPRDRAPAAAPGTTRVPLWQLLNDPEHLRVEVDGSPGTDGGTIDDLESRSRSTRRRRRVPWPILIALLIAGVSIGLTAVLLEKGVTVPQIFHAIEVYGVVNACMAVSAYGLRELIRLLAGLLFP